MLFYYVSHETGRIRSLPEIEDILPCASCFPVEMQLTDKDRLVKAPGNSCVSRDASLTVKQEEPYERCVTEELQKAHNPQTSF
jgi:hypothetical protein